MTTLTQEEIVKIVNYLSGTCRGIEEAIEYLFGDKYPGESFDVDQIESDIVGENLERCPGCEWWVESYELCDEDLDLCTCENCGKEKIDGG